MCLIVSLAQPRNTIVNKSRHLTFRRETVANFINVDKLHLACFSTAKYKETFSIQCYLVLPTTQNSGAARLTTLPSPVEQVSCVRPRTSHSNRNCQQRQTTPPSRPETCPRRAVLRVHHLESSVNRLRAPSPELPTPPICGTKVFAFLTDSQVI